MARAFGPEVYAGLFTSVYAFVRLTCALRQSLLTTNATQLLTNGELTLYTPFSAQFNDTICRS